jgi:uncharacterized protein (DUF697 family)
MPQRHFHNREWDGVMAKNETKKSVSRSEEEERSARNIDRRAREVIRNCAWGSAGIGLLPVPVVDLMAIGGLQVWLVRELAKTHGVPFSRDRAKAVVSALIGVAAPAMLAGGVSSLIKVVPVIGQVLTLAVAPGLAAASTLALGRVFNAHFKTGGTLLDFDADKMAAFYLAELNKAKEEVATAKAKGPAKTEATSAAA